MPPSSRAKGDVVRWLDDHFIASFRREVDPRMWTRTDDGHERGFFAITLLSLAYCEAMARLVRGKADGLVDTVRFIENHHGTLGTLTDSRYKGRAVALHMLFRHRLVHQREPGRLQIYKKHRLTWRIARNRKRDDHLRLVPAAVVGVVQEYELSVDADLLFDDTLKAFERIRDRCNADTALVTKIYQGHVSVSEARALPKPDSKNKVFSERLGRMLASPD